jgi:hypothetical protein
VSNQPAVSDEALARALGLYAGMVSRVLSNPQRWLGVDEERLASTRLPARALGAVRLRTLGDMTPASPEWSEQPVAKRVEWWVDRIGVGAGLAAAAPRFAGALADRIPLQAALGASAAGLAVCAVARENGIVEPAEWVPLLATVLFGRRLEPETPPVPTDQESEQQLEDAVEDTREPPSQMGALGRGAQRAVRTLWRLARTFLGIQDLLDERPRGGLLARAVAKLPVIGVAGGWFDERGGIRKAAKRTEELIAGGTPSARG